MQPGNTYEIEREKWDALAEHDTVMRPAPPDTDFLEAAKQTATLPGVAGFLGDLRGKRVLEYGCGRGALTALLARSGAEVTGFDLSARSINVARRRAAINNVEERVDLVVAAGEALSFADESFDIIFGKAILHHLDVTRGWYDLYRVLKTGGKAVFSEPMGMNPVLNFVRDYVPYPHKNPRGADRPLTYTDIHSWGKNFSQFWYEEFQLLSMLERGVGFHTALPALRQIDAILLERIPFLRRYCRYVVMFMVK